MFSNQNGSDSFMIDDIRYQSKNLKLKELSMCQTYYLTFNFWKNINTYYCYFGNNDNSNFINLYESTQYSNIYSFNKLKMVLYQ